VLGQALIEKRFLIPTINDFAPLFQHLGTQKSGFLSLAFAVARTQKRRAHLPENRPFSGVRATVNTLRAFRCSHAQNGSFRAVFGVFARTLRDVHAPVNIKKGALI
jgi:hypothetical protein